MDGEAGRPSYIHICHSALYVSSFRKRQAVQGGQDSLPDSARSKGTMKETDTRTGTDVRRLKGLPMRERFVDIPESEECAIGCLSGRPCLVRKGRTHKGRWVCHLHDPDGAHQRKIRFRRSPFGQFLLLFPPEGSKAKSSMDLEV